MKLESKIRRLMQRDGWRSLRSVAVKAGVDDSTLDRVVRRGGSISVDKAIQVARVLDVPVEWLFDDNHDWPPPAVFEPPPIAIHPWPPLGISWEEVKLAIAEYVAVRAAHEYLDELEEVEDEVEDMRRRRVLEIMHERREKIESRKRARKRASERSSASSQRQEKTPQAIRDSSEIPGPPGRRR